MKKTAVDSKFTCEFCSGKFVRASTIDKHLCETKNRWLERDKKTNQLGFNSWVQFFKTTTLHQKSRTYLDFIKSPYYSAFIKFGTYCFEINVINVSRYIDWLLKNNIRIDNWCQDTNYTKFLIEYLRVEDPMDAIARSIEHSMTLVKPENIKPSDCLRYINTNRICYSITTGKISPWMLYQSDSGVNFLSKLQQDHVAMITPYISPEIWAIKFIKDKEVVTQVKALLKEAGY